MLGFLKHGVEDLARWGLRDVDNAELIELQRLLRLDWPAQVLEIDLRRDDSVVGRHLSDNEL